MTTPYVPEALRAESDPVFTVLQHRAVEVRVPVDPESDGLSLARDAKKGVLVCVGLAVGEMTPEVPWSDPDVLVEHQSPTLQKTVGAQPVQRRRISTAPPLSCEPATEVLPPTVSKIPCDLSTQRRKISTCPCPWW